MHGGGKASLFVTRLTGALRAQDGEGYDRSIPPIEHNMGGRKSISVRYLQSARGQELIAKQAVEAGGGTPADAAAFVKLEVEKWEPVIKAANISLN